MLFFNEDAGGAFAGEASSVTESVEASGAAAGAGEASAWAWAREDGTLNEGWMERLPEDMRSQASLRAINSLPDLAKSYVETKRLIGAKLEMPGKKATPEQIANWRKAVGAPERPEGYLGEAKSLRPEAIPEGLWNQDSERRFLEIAHRHHLPTAAVQEILSFYGQDLTQGLQGAKQKEAAALANEGAKLRQTWGREYDANLASAARVARTAGLDPATHPIFLNAEVVQAFAKVGRLMSEDKLVHGVASGFNGSLADKIRSITDPGSTDPLARDYRGESGPEYQMAAQQQLHELMAAQSLK